MIPSRVRIAVYTIVIVVLATLVSGALFEVLADGVERDISQTLAPHLSLRMRVTPATLANELPRTLLQKAQ